MKNYKNYFLLLALVGLLFTSCSKEEDSIQQNEKATLSFGAVLNDLVVKQAALKEHLDIPSCSDDAPAFVDVVLTGATNVGAMDNPLRVSVNPNPADYDEDGVAEYFTDEHASLQLDAGAYALEYFVVRNAAEEVIWVAPASGGSMADFVDSPLPINFDLGNGVKKYVDVEVVCFDDRMVNEYGYLFFDIETTEAIEFCIFGNYCDENGRHFPAVYSVNVWTYADGERGDLIHENLENTMTVDENGDFTTSPVCMALPDRAGMDEYYFEITLEDSDAYGDVENRIVRAGVITDGDVRDLMDGDDNVDYYHFREGACNEADSPDLLDAEIYTVAFGDLNDSGVSGSSLIIRNGDKLTVRVHAEGLEPNMVHPQHIHGLDSSENATCPPPSADTNGDGIVDLEEGAPFYGPVLLELYVPVDDFPVADANGTISFERTFTLGETEFEEEGEVISLSELSPLENRTIVLHGMTVGGEYIATLPVACGQIMQVR